MTVRLTYGVSQQTLRRGKRAIGSGGSLSIPLQPYQTHRFGVDNLDLSGNNNDYYMPMGNTYQVNHWITVL